MPSSLVSETLLEYGELTRTALRGYLPSREPRRYLYDLIADYPERGGKMMRPALCIATAQALGARRDEALLTAVSIELLHNALLIHDDIQDESIERRGRPTLQTLHGVPLALNAGDMLSVVSLRPLLENRRLIGEGLTLRIIEETERVALECAEGQALELGWRRDNVSTLSEEDYFEMVMKKTCWLATIHPIRAGALIGSRNSVDPDHFSLFGFLLGAIFQVRDDLLNLVAAQAYGKELNGDIWEGKRTLMLIRLFREVNVEERDRLSNLMALSRKQRGACDIVWVRGLMDKYGCIDYARQITLGLAEAARYEFSRLSVYLPESRDKRFLEGMVDWILDQQ